MSDFLEVQLIAGWLPGLVTVDDGLVFWADCCRVWVRVVFSYMACPFVYSVSQLLSLKEIKKS